MFKPIPKKQITLAWINKYKDHLIQFSHLTENDFQTMWRLPGEPLLTNFASIPYDFKMPLYQKMILRYQQQGQKHVSAFWQSCDPCKRRDLLSKVCLVDTPSNDKFADFEFLSGILISDNDVLIEFFSWIVNMLGIYHIRELEEIDEDQESSSVYIPKWKENDIEFFFFLPPIKQQKLIDKFNEKCIDLFNEMFKNPTESVYSSSSDP